MKHRPRVVSPRFVVVHRGPGRTRFGWLRFHPYHGYRFTPDRDRATVFRTRRTAAAAIESCAVREHPVDVEQL